MPLISPNLINEEIKKVVPMRSANATATQVGAVPVELAKLLEDSNLTAEEVLENLSSMMRSGETDAVRMRAIEKGLELNRLTNTKDNTGAQFVVNINILDPNRPDVNPILFPR